MAEYRVRYCQRVDRSVLRTGGLSNSTIPVLGCLATAVLALVGSPDCFTDRAVDPDCAAAHWTSTTLPVISIVRAVRSVELWVVVFFGQKIHHQLVLDVDIQIQVGYPDAVAEVLA